MKKIIAVLLSLLLVSLLTGLSAAEPKIAVLTQKYDGMNIKNGDSAVEILGLKDGAKNQGADSFNKAVQATVGKFYDDFAEAKIDYPYSPDWIVIRSYPFTGKKYLQVITHYVTYPNYGSDGNIASFVYDKNKKNLVTAANVMKQYGLDETELTRRVKKWYDDGYKEGKESVTEVKPAGVYIWESSDSDASVPKLILYVTVDNPDADEWTYLYTYEPEGDKQEWSRNPLEKMDIDYLFPPHTVDRMNPPLLVNKADS